MSRPEDRIIVPCVSGCWEVRAPGATRTGLHARSRSEAVQWAWNITRSTGGQVIVHRGDRSSDPGPSAGRARGAPGQNRGTAVEG